MSVALLVTPIIVVFVFSYDIVGSGITDLF